ncbi:cinnamoyl-CoA reductase [Aspergillus nomiae NRRL 13137]|uniref:Cinnamoyl-CoA reductase n=1 Tax=Aspergillus nomiae NRRL (strain ATCC 15546 / NRRL 13137 / CBS 260.88 / M93) TaxID=1509407 RepID=A0A0L1J5F8_ASPN3|nr:cinnamoyl-CoA reductase [Aspergillus nomiae NRRL 13137]KNG86962.1 cinnamoyl-CoA reductase [Aspergillus nomiae NRRL 13137]
MASINKELYAIAPGSRVLVTGANGFIGSHVVQQLLSLGYVVRGTVRSQKPWLEELFRSKFGPNSFESVVIPDLSDLDTLIKAMSDVSGVIHVASDVSFSPHAEEVIPRVVSATETILEAAARQPEGSIQRVVLTSSASAAALPQPGVEGIVVTEDTWNIATVTAAFDESTPADAKPFTVYVASKTEGERAAWKWVEKNKPAFVFNAVLPYYTLGQVLHPEIPGSTMKWAANLLKGDVAAFGFPGQFVDVVDLARVHVVGLLHPEVKSERLFAFASTFTWKEFVSILQKFRPGNVNIPSPPENELRDLSDIVPAQRAENLIKSFFGRSGWIGLEESIRAGIDSLGY